MLADYQVDAVGTTSSSSNGAPAKSTSASHNFPQLDWRCSLVLLVLLPMLAPVVLVKVSSKGDYDGSDEMSHVIPQGEQTYRKRLGVAQGDI